MSRLPTLPSYEVKHVANILMESRQAVVTYLNRPGSKVALRDVISSTQIYQILKKNGIYVELSHLKVLLRDLGFSYNGPSASFTILFSACKAYLHGITGYGSDMGGIRSNATASEYSALSKRHPSRKESKVQAQAICAMLKDMIYATKQNLYELFKVGMTGSSLDLEGFKRIISEVGGGCVPDSDMELCFQGLAKNRAGKISFQTFEETFKSEIPSGLEFET